MKTTDGEGGEVTTMPPVLYLEEYANGTGLSPLSTTVQLESVKIKTQETNLATGLLIVILGY